MDLSYVLKIIKGKWNPPKDTRPSFSGHNVLVTGANSGLGLEAAVKFVQLGAAKVVLGVRTLSKGEEAQKQIEARTGRKGVAEVWHLDMLDYASIKAFAEQATKLERLDIAVLNAGVVMSTYKESSYGYEQTMQVNVLSTALLALLLIPKLKASKTSTYTPVLEIVGSTNHYLCKSLNSNTTPFASYNGAAGFSGPEAQYSVSKLFVMYAQTGLVQIANNTETKTTNAYVTVVCPGATKSDLARDITAWYLRAALAVFAAIAQRQTEQGARTYISGVNLGEKAHGKFWQDDAIREPAPLLIGEKGKALQVKVWEEIVEALQKDVPEVEQLVAV